MKTETKHKIILSLGSNLGNLLHNIDSAFKLIEIKLGEIVNSSSNYFTKAWGFETDNMLFVNNVIIVETTKNIETCLKVCKEIESDLGRKEKTTSTYSDRIIDIDILFFDTLIYKNKENLVVPHPKLHERNFVLYPLNEIVPNFIHPVLQKTCNDLWKSSIDNSEVVLNA